eukprot:6181861-Pleurochrysis_carterae.AAC.1
MAHDFLAACGFDNKLRAECSQQHAMLNKISAAHVHMLKQLAPCSMQQKLGPANYYGRCCLVYRQYLLTVASK